MKKIICLVACTLLNGCYYAVPAQDVYYYEEASAPQYYTSQTAYVATDNPVTYVVQEQPVVYYERSPDIVYINDDTFYNRPFIMAPIYYQPHGSHFIPKPPHNVHNPKPKNEHGKPTSIKQGKPQKLPGIGKHNKH